MSDDEEFCDAVDSLAPVGVTATPSVSLNMPLQISPPKSKQRHRKLESLRDRMHVDIMDSPTADETTSSSSHFLCAASTCDQASIASWSKQMLLNTTDAEVVCTDEVDGQAQAASSSSSSNDPSHSSKDSTMDSTMSGPREPSRRSMTCRAGSLDHMTSGHYRSALQLFSKSCSLPRDSSLSDDVGLAQHVHERRASQAASDYIDTLTSHLIVSDSPRHRLSQVPEELPPQPPGADTTKPPPDVISTALALGCSSSPVAPPRRKHSLRRQRSVTLVEQSNSIPSDTFEQADKMERSNTIPYRSDRTLQKQDSINPLSLHLAKRVEAVTGKSRETLSPQHDDTAIVLDDTLSCNSLDASIGSAPSRSAHPWSAVVHLRSVAKKTKRLSDVLRTRLHAGFHTPPSMPRSSSQNLRVPKDVDAVSIASSISDTSDVTNRSSIASGAHRRVPTSGSGSGDGGTTVNTSVEIENIKLRASRSNKGPYYFDQVRLVQDLGGEHTGAIWCMRFSLCGRLLATAGQDTVIRLWALKGSEDDFIQMHRKYTRSKLPQPSMQVSELHETDSLSDSMASSSTSSDILAPFSTTPLFYLTGHTSDVLNLTWSKNLFLLSSSMDRTVRLWHTTRNQCLCCFQHTDLVSAVSFIPKDDRYFLSASLDGKLRMWNILEKKVSLWNEVEDCSLVTTVCILRSHIVVGTMDGRCIFYNAIDLQYFTRFAVTKSAAKITGLEATASEDRLLVTSSDSRIRLYDLRDFHCICKYRGGGFSNSSSQIMASFSPDTHFAIAGSENKSIYIWRLAKGDLSLSLRHRGSGNPSKQWESIRAHTAVVTSALFSPNPSLVFGRIASSRNETKSDGDVIVSSDIAGTIFVFLNKPKVKAGSSTFVPSY